MHPAYEVHVIDASRFWGSPQLTSPTFGVHLTHLKLTKEIKSRNEP